MPASAAGQAPRGGSGVGSESALECRRFEVAGVGVDIRQDLHGSNALRPLDDDSVWGGDSDLEDDGQQPPLLLTAQDLSRVGLVVWQAGFVLADLLLRRPPFGSWHGAHVLDLGCGTGLVGILLALAGADVTLSDQPHIGSLAEGNMQLNLTPGLHRARFVGYTWGHGDAAAALLPPVPAAAGAPLLSGGTSSAAAAAPPSGGPGPAGAAGGPSSTTTTTNPPPGPVFDVITAADVVYQPEQYAELATTLRTLAAPHTLVLVSFKNRRLQEDSFLEELEAVGFAVQEVPQAQLAPEYASGSYRVVRACRID